MPRLLSPCLASTRNPSYCSWDARQHQFNTLISYAGWLGLSPVISEKIHSNCASQRKIAKNTIKASFSGSRSFKVIDVGTPAKLVGTEQCLLVMIRSKSVSICNRSLARLDDSSRNRAFWRGSPNLMYSYGGLLKPRGSNHLRLTPNISYAGCPGLSWTASAQFTLKMCMAAWNREKFTKNPYFWGSRTFKVIDVGTAGKLVSSACYDKRQVCVYLQPISR